jgi:hypothetical protein
MMDYKKTNAPVTTVTRNLDDFAEKTGNLYQAMVICSKMADKINEEIRTELYQKLEEFATVNDNLEEVHENREQIEVSRYFERLPKPSLIAIEEFLNDRVYYTKYVEESEKDIIIDKEL